jgi:hypothetical protein
MTQSEVNRAVARATGESVETIGHMGFSIADPDQVTYDPEPCAFEVDLEAKIVDWDQLDADRRMPLVYQPAA